MRLAGRQRSFPDNSPILQRGPHQAVRDDPYASRQQVLQPHVLAAAAIGANVQAEGHAVAVADNQLIRAHLRCAEGTEPAKGAPQHLGQVVGTECLQGQGEEGGAVAAGVTADAHGPAVAPDKRRLGEGIGRQRVGVVIARRAKHPLEVEGERPQPIAHRVVAHPSQFYRLQVLGVRQYPEIIGGEARQAGREQVILRRQEQPAAIVQVRRQARLVGGREGIQEVVAGEPDDDRVEAQAAGRRAAPSLRPRLPTIPIIVGHAAQLQGARIHILDIDELVVVHQQDRRRSLGHQVHRLRDGGVPLAQQLDGGRVADVPARARRNAHAYGQIPRHTLVEAEASYRPAGGRVEHLSRPVGISHANGVGVVLSADVAQAQRVGDEGPRARDFGLARRVERQGAGRRKRGDGLDGPVQQLGAVRQAAYPFDAKRQIERPMRHARIDQHAGAAVARVERGDRARFGFDLFDHVHRRLVVGAVRPV